ncbi:MAG: AAA family ATPase [Methylobacteriaceae bacterium]|nr:AAA family ATPase [Methylobacteriaceae bacterium]
MIVENQDEAIEFLHATARARTGAAAEIISTHISTVALFGDTALKLKRAVRLPYVDFSTAERRAAACRVELDLNRRTAPALYRAVRDIRRGADGRLAFADEGPLVDSVVEMRRFDQRDLFDAMAREGRLTAAHVEALAAHVAAFHAREAAVAEGGGAAGLAAAMAINAQGLRAATLFDRAAVERLIADFEAALARHRDLLEARRRGGRVRRCHGDLTLRNICLFEGAPLAFDCLDFDPALATTDVLYDLAFPLMDLWRDGAHDLANLAFNAYLDRADEIDGLALTPLFMATRAAVRAHVAATLAMESAAPEQTPAGRDARDYFDLAASLLRPARPRLVAIGGFSGSGKSTLARALAAHVGGAPGARRVASDRLRKAMFGVEATQRLPESAYAGEVSARVYDQLEAQAARALAAGGSVIADAVFDRAERRAAIEAAARAAGVDFVGLWLEAPAATLQARVAARQHDPSDATAAVVADQLARGAGDIGWTRIAAGGDQAASFAAASAALGFGPPSARSALSTTATSIAS